MKMVLYSYQKPEAVENLKKDGFLRLVKKDRKLTTLQDLDNIGFDKAYEFIIHEMSAKFPKKFKDTYYPIWAWYINGGEIPPTESLDECHKGLFRLKIEIDDSRVLLSDFDMFCYLAGYGYYFDIGKKQHRLYEGKYGMPDEFFYPNWREMFKLHRKRGNQFCFNYKKESVQATFWELFIEDVTEIKFIE